MAQYERSAETPGASPMAFPMAGFAAMQSIANSMMRTNLELMGLASRRARAHMELPKLSLGCRTPAEAGQIGAQFWREAVQDYMTFNQRMLGHWVESMTAAGQGGVARKTAEFASEMSRPMEAAAEHMADDPAEPWAWWRTDMKGLKPQGNGHHAPDSGRASRAGY